MCACVCACVYILHALFKRTALWAWLWASSPNCRLVCCLSARRSLFGLTGDSLPLAGFTCTQRKGDRRREEEREREEGASLHVRTCGVPFTTWILFSCIKVVAVVAALVIAVFGCFLWFFCPLSSWCGICIYKIKDNFFMSHKEFHYLFQCLLISSFTVFNYVF